MKEPFILSVRKTSPGFTLPRLGKQLWWIPLEEEEVLFYMTPHAQNREGLRLPVEQGNVTVLCDILFIMKQNNYAECIFRLLVGQALQRIRRRVFG